MVAGNRVFSWRRVFDPDPVIRMGVVDANQERVSPTHLARGNLLSVRDLSVNFRVERGRESNVVRQVSFTIAPGEIVGLLGESGSGKTTTALALLQLLPEAARITTGSIHFCGRDLLTLNARQLREIRGEEISIIHQDSAVLNPVMRAGNQVMEVLRAHKFMKAAQMRDEIYTLFTALGLHDCERVYRSFPHQLSGGQRRRIAIAQALVCKPRLVIADEPSAWLDAYTTAGILSVFRQLREMYDTAFLLISHDPDALMVADRVLVMYAGEIVEDASLHEIFELPKHPYTTALLQCSGQSRTARSSNIKPCSLPCIPGQAPDPFETRAGCAFSSRCAYHLDACDLRSPELLEISTSRLVRCIQYEARG
jgi:oligopeptide/dipeptide ABC transporter ATP-binding protein